jgi:hypothetical protein
LENFLWQRSPDKAKYGECNTAEAAHGGETEGIEDSQKHRFVYSIFEARTRHF